MPAIGTGITAVAPSTACQVDRLMQPGSRDVLSPGQGG
jgi:hypothetical protein